MSLPKVSIITPSFNQAEFLPETIESVVSQDYQYVEYIIIDGGSEDDSIEIIKQYAEKYPYIKWISEKDRGQSHAINKGFNMSSGEIVAWLNSDDTYEDNAIATQVEYLMSHPDIDLVYADAGMIDANGYLKYLFPYIEPFDLDRLINHNIMIIQPTCFWRSTLFENVGYLDENLNFTMDWDFWIRVGKKGKIAYNPIHIANTREYETTKTFGGGFKRFKEIRITHSRHSNRIFPELLRNLFLDTLYKNIYYVSPFMGKLLKRVVCIIFNKKYYD